MAFLGKFGNILRQGANKRIGLDLQASSLSICQAVRWMSSMQSSKLFVGGISYNTDDQSLREAFAKYGEVLEARIIVDRETGRSRGFGFVTFTSSEEASSAIQALDGQDLHGRRVRVNYANDRTRGFGGGGGYGGGSYGGGGGGYGGGGYGGGGGDGYGGGGYGGGGGYSGGGAGGYGGGGSGGGYGDGSGGYSGTGYSSGGNYSRGSGGNYSNDNASDNLGSVGTGGGGFGGNDAGYNAASNFASGNTHDSGTNAGFGNVSGGGSDYFANSGFDASSGVGGYTGGEQFGSETNTMDASGDQGLGEQLEGNDRDEDDTDDFAKRA
ncbi:glycine-rich RNA-binding protein 3, mitochondrial-like [Benincasa hispida]|uniref:glycine-rich RNA-binding protein 3, mitochondrial-like n=1 Tax=Benincasa hispida TaxID=102211 RepID=UPI001901B0A3|nr:glycine-rich RNA-binding protein 3, mitochondrial-like [Benincasa hispida]